MDEILQDLYHGMIHPEEEYQPTEEIKVRRKKLDAQQRELMEKFGGLSRSCAVRSKNCMKLKTQWMRWRWKTHTFEACAWVRGLRWRC